SNRMPDGGLATTLTDITPSVEAAEALERANETLERRVRERTEELTRLNAALARAKAEAEKANISKTHFLAAASHDILQPLNAARLYVTSLIERNGSGEAAPLIAHLHASLESVEEILGVLLDISRLDAGAMKPEVTAFRIDELFRQLEVEFAPLAREKGLALAFVPSSLAVRSDRRLLRRLLQNLVSNAVKYTRQGRVLVGCRRRGARLRIDIYDTGIGIPPSKTKAIFREFHRLQQGAQIARGLGLGLSIVERIARVLDHTISLNSVVGGGSHFSVQVPLAPALPGDLPQPHLDRAELGELAGMTVLCIDNDAKVLDGMETLLTGWRCQVLKATDLKTAQQAILGGAARPAGLLIDYHLDSGNGLDAITELRWRLGDLPAILITADRSPRVRNAARACNVRLLHKPVKPASLRALLAQWRMHVAAQEAQGAAPALRRHGLPLLRFDLRADDHRLGAAVDPELLQDRGDVGLHGGFRHPERIGDLFVEQSLGKHHQHADLLGRQASQARHQLPRLRIDAEGEIDIGRIPRRALEYLADRFTDRLDRQGLRDEAGRAEFHAAPDHCRVLIA